MSKRFLIHCVYALTILILAAGSTKGGYTPLTAEEIYSLIPSPTRFVASLYGKWEASFDENEWFTVTIPYSSINKETITYKRTVKIEDRLVQRLVWHLYFLGLDDQVEVYFNNQYVGKYLGGMTPFSVRIPERMITNETNTIKLVVLSATSAPRQIKEQNIFSKRIQTGIPREVLLVGTPQIWVSRLKHKLKFNSSYSNFQVLSTVDISSANIQKLGLISDSAQAKLSLKGDVFVEATVKKKSTGEVVSRAQPQRIELASERTITLNFDLPVNSPVLWTSLNPELYQIETRIIKNNQVIDQYSQDIGFRHFSTNSDGKTPAIYLNDSLLDLKGVDYIEDYYGDGQTISTKRMERDILMMKTLGANLICVKYAVPNPYFLKLCDEYGMLVLIELPIYDVPYSLMGYDEIKVRMKNISDLIITQYSNHPSIMGWGISDGSTEGEPLNIEFSKLISGIFKSANSNLIYKTVRFGTKTLNTDGFDFVIFRDNHEFRDYDKINDEIYRLKLLANNVPSLINYGIATQPFNHNGFSDPLSLESQANYISNIYRLIKSQKFAGSLLWSFNDYLLNHPVLTLDNNDMYVCTSGLVDRSRQERLSFLTLQSLFNNEKEPLLNAGSYSEKPPVTFIFAGLLLIGILVFLIKRYRRFREYIDRSIRRPFNFYADIRDQRIMSSVQTIVLGLMISITLSIFIVSIFYFYRTSDNAEYLLMLLFPSNSILELIYRGIWMPEALSAILTLIFFSSMFLGALIIKLFSLLVKGRIYYSDTFTITIWSSVPFLLLLPLTIILIRLLYISPNVMWIVLFMLVILKVWVLLRILKATAIVFDIPRYRSYLIGLAFTGIIAGIAIAIYQYQYAIISYLTHFIDIILSS
jgi:beta-galactosidase